MKYYKITLNNHFRLALFHVFGTGLMLLAIYIFNSNRDIIFIFFCYWLLYTIPALYLHMEYYFTNKGYEIGINSIELILKKEGLVKTYNINDLSKIIVYKSASLDKGGIQFTAIESYHYARIITKSGEEIVITCLLIPNLDEFLSQLNAIIYQRKKRFFCTLNWK